MARIRLEQLKVRSARVRSATSRGPGSPENAGSAEKHEIENLRGILLGSLPDDCEARIQRVEAKVAEEAAALDAGLEMMRERIEQRIAMVDEAARGADAKLRQQIQAQVRAVRETIDACHANAKNRIEQSFAAVEGVKLDRSAFSDFLGGLSRHIGQDGAPATAQEPR